MPSRPHVTPDLYRQVLARFASGVTVVTVDHGGRRAGFTASSFTSVSLEPPLVLVCAARRLDALALIDEAGRFGVSLLAAGQRDHGLRFAGLLPGVHDRFEGVDLRMSRSGTPWVDGSLAWMDCRVWARYDGGDHVILVGEVVEAEVGGANEALGYFERHWQRLVRLEPASPAPREATAAPVTDLGTLLRTMSPALVPGDVVFVGLDEGLPPGVRPIALIREQEGDCAIVPREDAERAGLAYEGTFTQITLNVLSDLHAVGLVAALAQALAAARIACNVVSGLRHDHLFVPSVDAERAFAILRALERANQSRPETASGPASD